MYLIFDVSANGKPKSYKAAHDDIFNWPRLIHLSWIELDADLKPLADHDFIITPHGFVLTEEVMSKAYIEADALENKSHPVKEVLEKFTEAAKRNEFVFAHNLAFNEGILGAEYYRASMSNPLIAADKYCLMHEATYYCKLPGKKGYKWPSLQEMHTIIFKQGFTPSNNARADVIAATRCFIALKKARAFEDIFADE
jgi:hypothetical protein